MATYNQPKHSTQELRKQKPSPSKNKEQTSKKKDKAESQRGNKQIDDVEMHKAKRCS